MLVPTIIMGAIAFILLAIGYYQGQRQHISGMKLALKIWSLWAFSRLPMEVGILGWKFTLIRVASTFFFPPIAGLIAQILFSGAK